MADNKNQSPPHAPKPEPVEQPKAKKEAFYRYLRDDALYALTVVEDDPRGNTHKAVTEGKYWEGTAAEFKAQFDRQD